MDNEICYTGAIYDKETGLYYMNARYYDALTGRFISQDSYRGEIEDVGTGHLYAYCANNPINYVDPSGHSWMTLSEILNRAKNKKQKKAINVKERYRGNIRRVSAKGSGSALYKYICDQSLYSYIKFRSTNIADDGCGIVATYNLLKYNDSFIPFLRLTAEYDYKMTTNGKAGIYTGTVKQAINYYLSSKSYLKMDNFVNNIGDGDSGVILYKHSQGNHYVSFEKKQDYILLRNRKKSNTKVCGGLRNFFKDNRYTFKWGAIVN